MSDNQTQSSAENARAEVVTHALSQDITLPSTDGKGAGTFVLVTLDNGFDHTKPNSFGPQGLAELEKAVDAAAERAAKGEIVGFGVTGKPFIMAVGADLMALPSITDREQAVDIAEQGHRVFSKIADLDVPTFAFVNGASMGGGVEIGRGDADVLDAAREHW